jgi:hypothetical protein
MNKFLTISAILFMSASLLQAQNYVRVKQDFTIKSIKFFKDEIYPYDSTDKKFIVNEKKYRCTNNVELYKNVTKLEDTDKFIKDAEDGKFIRIDVSSVDNEKDTIWLANSAEKVLPIVMNKTITVERGKLDNSFRLIIPNAATVWYDKGRIVLPWWIYVTAGVLLLLIIRRRKTLVTFIRRYISGKEKKPFRTVVFNGSIMSEFADKYGGMDKLHKLNPRLIPSQEKWDTMDDYDKRRTVIKLKGKSIKIPFEATGSRNVDTLQSSGEKYRQTSKINFRAIDKAWIEEQLKAKDSEISWLYQEKESLTTEKAQLEAQLQAQNEEINLLQQEKIRWNGNYVSLSEYQKLETRYNALNGKALSVDFLRNYAETISAYFDLCREVERKADSYYDRIVLRYDYDASIIACLLQNFRNSVSVIPVGNWQQIILDIKDTGITANKQVIRILSQPPAESEKQREFMKMLFREVIIRYSSSILILAESFRNLSRFKITTAFADEAGLEFEKHVAAIVSKAQTVDMEIKYVPLFKKFDGYSAKIESVDKHKSFPYNAAGDLERDDIAEIISYGVKTEFEDTKTQIIIE